MVNRKVLGIGVLGFVLLLSGLFLWTFGFESTILDATRYEWSPLPWFLGIMVLLSMALVYCLAPRYYIMLTVLFIAGFVVLFYILSIIFGLFVP